MNEFKKQSVIRLMSLNEALSRTQGISDLQKSHFQPQL